MAGENHWQKYVPLPDRPNRSGGSRVSFASSTSFSPRLLEGSLRPINTHPYRNSLTPGSSKSSRTAPSGLTITTPPAPLASPSTTAIMASSTAQHWQNIMTQTPIDEKDDECVKSLKACVKCDIEKKILKLLPCLHSMCPECLQLLIAQHSSRGTIRCPLCDKKLAIPDKGVEGFEDNIYFQFSELSVTDAVKCDVCKSRSPNCRCSECNVNMCSECVKEHLTTNKGQSHYVVNLQQQMIGKHHWEEVCREHQPFKLELYCLNCCEPICGRCSIGKHNNHIVDAVQAAASERKSEIMNAVIDTSGKRIMKDVEDQITTNKKVKECTQKDVDATVEAVQLHIQKLKDELDAFGKKIVDEVRGREKNMIEVLDKKIQSAESNRNSLRIASETAKHIAERTREIEFLRRYSSLKETLLEMKRTNRSFPIYGTHIRYVPLVQTLKTVGRIESESLLTHHIQFFATSTIQLAKHISAICPLDESKAWVGFRKFIQICGKDGTIGPRVDMGDTVYAVAANSNGSVFVACKTSIKVITAKLNPKFLFQLAHEPSDLILNDNDDIVVSFKEAKRVAVFNTKGKVILDFDIRNLGFRFGMRVNDPWKMALGKDGCIYVTDFSSENVAVFEASGEMKYVFRSNVYRHASLCFNGGLLFIADYRRDCVQVFSEDGQHLQTCNTEGITAPCSIAMDKTGDLWLGAWSGFVKVYCQR